MGDPGQIGGYVRNWLHYDNLATSFYKQANRARQIKDQYEGKILDELRAKHGENTIIQINGGTLSVVEERNPKTLSLVRIEQLLHQYYHKHGATAGAPGTKDPTEDIMRFIKSNRGYDVAKKIKKTSVPNIPQPGPSGLPPMPTGGMIGH